MQSHRADKAALHLIYRTAADDLVGKLDHTNNNTNNNIDEVIVLDVVTITYASH